MNQWWLIGRCIRKNASAIAIQTIFRADEQKETIEELNKAVNLG